MLGERNKTLPGYWAGRLLSNEVILVEMVGGGRQVVPIDSSSKDCKFELMIGQEQE